MSQVRLSSHSQICQERQASRRIEMAMAAVKYSAEEQARIEYEVGIDTGATFTDVVAHASGSAWQTSVPLSCSTGCCGKR